MTELLFDKLVIQNFKTFIGPPTTINLRMPGLIFVRGHNVEDPQLGANNVGKTNMFGALTWCLNGRTVDNQRNPDIKPWAGGAEATKVEVTIVRDNAKHVIARTASTNGLSLDGAQVSQDEIDRLLGFNFEVFAHTILLGQGQPLFLDLTPERQMELFVETLDLDRWDARSVRASSKVRELELDLASTKGEISGAEAALVEVRQLIKHTQASLAEWQTERAAKLTDYSAEIKELTEKRDRLQRKRDKANLAYDSAMTELKALDKKIEGLNADLRKADGAVSRCEVLLEDLERRKVRMEQDFGLLAKAKTCPLCGQSVAPKDLTKHKQELTDNLASIVRSIKAKSSELAKEREVLDAAHTEVERAYAFRRNFVDKADLAQTNFDQVADEVVKLTTTIANLTKVQTEKDNASNPHRETLTNLRRKRQSLDDKLDELDKKVVTLERRITRTTFWVKAFKDIRLAVIEDVLQELELVTNTLLPESGLDGWQIRYAVERETKSGNTKRGLNVTVLSPSNTKAVKWAVWGGGVGQRMRIVSTLALAEVLLAHAGVQTNLQILDEPTRGLSVEGVQDLCEFLSARAEQQQKTIFYVDHLAVESAHFDRVLTVTKSSKGSRVK